MLNQIVLIFFFSLNFSLFPERTFSEKPSYVDYEFPDETLPRQKLSRFPKAGIMISSFCVYKKNSDYQSRECKAWRLYDYIDSGKLIPLIREKGFFTEGDSTSKVASLICSEVKGIIETEVDEYNPNGRRNDPEDFCTFKDGSVSSFKGILLYIYRNAPAIRMEIEKARKLREKKPELKL